MTTPKPNTQDMELAVTGLLNFRVYTIVPNVSWGLGLGHECDLLALDQQRRFTEIEIKISKSDLVRDFLKPHGHKSKSISRLIYAVPDHLLEFAKTIIPNEYGIVSVSYNARYKRFEAKHIRKKKHRVCIPPHNDLIIKFMSLGCMRIWTLKEKLKKSKP